MKNFIFFQHLTNNDPQFHYTVEGDWSGGAFLLVAGAIAGEITVDGLECKFHPG